MIDNENLVRSFVYSFVRRSFVRSILVRSTRHGRKFFWALCAQKNFKPFFWFGRSRFGRPATAENFLGASRPKKILNLFSGSVDSGSVDPSRPKKFLGAIAPKKILHLFSGSVDPGSVDPGSVDFPKISAKISTKILPKTSPKF